LEKVHSICSKLFHIAKFIEMEQDPETLSRLLASSVGDLVSAPGTDPTELEEARIAVLASLKSGHEVEDLTLHQISSRNTPPETTIALERTIAEGTGTSEVPAQKVRRRALAVSRLAQPLLNSGQLVDRSLGPFMDSVHRPVLLDVLTPIPLIGFQWRGAAQPFLYISNQQVTGNSSRIDLTEGSVWIASSQFVSGAPDPSFIGLSIVKGAIHLFSASLDSRPIMIGTGTPMQVSLELNVDDTGMATPSTAKVVVPKNVTFLIHGPGPGVGTRLTAADDAELDFFGSTTKFSFLAALPIYVASTFRIEFPLKSESAAFIGSNPTSSIAQFGGEAQIETAAWSIPVIQESANALAAANGAGGLSLSLGAGLKADVLDKTFSMACNQCTLLAETQDFSLVGQSGVTANMAWFIASTRGTTVNARIPGPFQYAYERQADGTEIFEASVPITASLDQPRDVNGSRTSFVGVGVCSFEKNGNVTTTSVFANSPTPPGKLRPVSYSLKNFMLGLTEPTSLTSVATQTTGLPTQASASVNFGIRWSLPILPDPYTTNFPLSPLLDTASTANTANTGLQVAILSAPPAESAIEITIVPVLSTSSVIARSVSPTSTLHDILLSPPSSVLQDPRHPSLGLTEPFLLDLSTNVSQFGVALGTTEDADQPGASGSTPRPGISDLMLNFPGTLIQVVTLPAVQWEPVYTPDPMVYLDSTNVTHSFPTPLRFNDSGQVTTFSSNTATLVPFSPRDAIDGLVDNFKTSRTNVVKANFTLPFGIIASAQLIHSAIQNFPSPGLLQVQPSFASATMKGGDQVSLRGVTNRPFVLHQSPDIKSPSIPGTAVQLQNTLPNTAPPLTAISSAGIDVITDGFNQTFNSPTTGSIPVTRIDISGFGESVFSDWNFQDDTAGTSISKVQFDVMVGRTAREVIQLTSICHWVKKIRMVRTITIERQNTGTVVRHDSGWQSVGNGFFLPANITHPGIVGDVTNITNIRDLNSGPPVTVQNPSDPTKPIELVAVKFDCMVALQNAVAGSSATGIPARDVIGYVQKTIGGPLDASQFDELLSKVSGSLGGNIDCTVKVGDSGQQIRLSQVSIATALNAGSPEFCIATLGVPLLPGGGQWSFLMLGRNDQAPSAITQNGVPIVRQGRSDQVVSASSPYRFCDPSDMFVPTTPQTNYCLCHATGTQRLLFPRPVINASAPWAITSDAQGIPFLADSFALGTSTGPFPRLSVCIPFNDANYQLLISPNGDFKLQLQPNSTISSFTAAPIRRILTESKSTRAVVFAGDDKGNPSKVTIMIDTSNHTIPWSIEIDNFSVISECPVFGDGEADPRASEVSRIIGSTIVAANAPARVAGQPAFVFGPAMKPVQDALAILEKFGPLPPLDIHMTNPWSVDAFLDVQLDNLLKQVPGPVAEFLEEFFESIELQIRFSQDGTKSSADFSFKVRAKFGEVYVITVLGIIGWSLSSTGGTIWSLQLGGGAGGDMHFGPFSAFASLEFTLIGQVGSHGVGWGFSVLITAHIDWKLLSLELNIEAGHMSMKTICDAGETKWGLLQLTVAIDLHICFIVDIDFTYHGEKKEKYNGGPCDMDIQNGGLVGAPP
jgi:hypothetical protein